MENGLSRDDGEFIYRMVDQAAALDLHFAMFVPTLIGQGTKEQVSIPARLATHSIVDAIDSKAFFLLDGQVGDAIVFVGNYWQLCSN